MNEMDELALYWSPIVASYLKGATVLPPYLGLTEAQYTDICRRLDLDYTSPEHESQHQHPNRLLRLQLQQLRNDEVQELCDLMAPHSNPDSELTAMMAKVLSIACLGNAHLWHDLGMPERPRLGQLFKFYFPSLHALNTKNMRWKRFLYKQLCENGGDYVCRAPSCEQCSSYSECFLSETEEA